MRNQYVLYWYLRCDARDPIQYDIAHAALAIRVDMVDSGKFCK